MQDSICEKCGVSAKMNLGNSTKLKCIECGARYDLKTEDVDNLEVNYTYEFVEFQCVHSTYAGHCENKCLAPGMYCMEHLSDEAFVSAKSNIKYFENKLEEAERILEQKEESKKLWLIEKVSGINE